MSKKNKRDAAKRKMLSRCSDEWLEDLLAWCYETHRGEKATGPIKEELAKRK